MPAGGWPVTFQPPGVGLADDDIARYLDSDGEEEAGWALQVRARRGGARPSCKRCAALPCSSKSLQAAQGSWQATG